MEQQKTMKKWYKMVKNPQNEEDEQFAFAITKGKFKQVIYKYNRFGLIEPEKDAEELKYRFEYDILEIPENIQLLESNNKLLKEINSKLKKAD